MIRSHPLKKKKCSNLFRFGAPFLLVVSGMCILPGFLFGLYIDAGAGKLLKLEKQGRLSREYGYVWQEIRTNRKMALAASGMTGTGLTAGSAPVIPRDGERKISDFPSLSAIMELNGIENFNRTIRVDDRHGIPLAELKTTQTSIRLSQLGDVLVKSLLASEDKNFNTRSKGYELNALLRATLKAGLLTLRTMRIHLPRGSSTIHMQVARFLLMKSDRRGFAYAEKSISRKLNELKLAQALRTAYSNDEILTCYVNHCVSAGRGMTGYGDISRGLFGVPPDSLTIPQSLYLARLVKWNRHLPGKIIGQIKAGFPFLSEIFDWNADEREKILLDLDSLKFLQPRPVIPENGYILDLANEYLRRICRSNGMEGEELDQMDISDPESMIRRFGNCRITLTIDARVQRSLERAVAARGFGSDTTIRTDVRIGSAGVTLARKTLPPDTLRSIRIVGRDTLPGNLSAAPGAGLRKGDTVVCTVRYGRAALDSVRRSCFYYKRDTLRVPGQYYSYAIMNSRTRELLAYCSRDLLGSRLQSLHVNRNPNGSSVAKPLIYGLAYDLDVYGRSDLASDDREVPDTCAWARKYLNEGSERTGMVYLHDGGEGGYAVRNYGRVFQGYDFLFNHLASSNNILAVETLYRLGTRSAEESRIHKTGLLLGRLGRGDLSLSETVSGPQLYCAMASVVTGDGIACRNNASNHSIALGTLELSLYEQMHLFNALYLNRLSVSPARHPSLFVKRVEFSGHEVPWTDRTRDLVPFDDPAKIAPVRLALHKRLVSNPSDGLGGFDICENDGEQESNFAKSGTTDDVIRPFNSDVTDSARTCYGLWNAVLRLRLTRENLRREACAASTPGREEYGNVRFDSVPAAETVDVTLASIGECNQRFTGDRDGKSLHGYVSRELLHAYGTPCPDGFYRSFEEELVGDISEKIRYSGREKSDLPFLSRALIKLRTGIGPAAEVDEVAFEKDRSGRGIRLRGKSFRKMLKFAPYMEANSRKYRELLERLRRTVETGEAREILNRVTSLEIGNRILKRDVGRACSSLRRSIEALERTPKEAG